MNSAEINALNFSYQKNISFPTGQILFLLLFLCIGSVLILTNINQAPYRAVLLLFFITIFGLILCNNFQNKLNDNALKTLGYFWLIKLSLTLLILFAAWLPETNINTASNWGADAQRFYMQSKELIDNNWSPSFVSLNYTGILYYYGIIFYIFGYNPIAPALVNSLISLLGMLYLIKTAYEIKGDKTFNKWNLAIALILPEVIIYYGVLTLREALVATLILFSLLTFGRYLIKKSSLTFTKTIILMSISIILIAVIRPPMLFPILISMFFMQILIKKTSFKSWFSLEKTIIFSGISLILIAIPLINTFMGGYEIDFSKLYEMITNSKANYATLDPNISWNNNSFGKLLLPNDWLQAILFVLPRIILNFFTPFPSGLMSLGEVYNWYIWNNILISLSSIINIIALPFNLAGFIYSLKNRKIDSSPLVFYIPFWVIFIAIAGGNLVIDERYRTMVSMLMWGCAWLGANTAPKSYIIKASLFWYGLLAIGTMFYISYKFIFV